jgi:hypothetical protein
MLIPDPGRWGQSLQDLHFVALKADHPRTRERFLALYILAKDGGGASAYARSTGRDRCTVMDWVNQYNRLGPDSLVYRSTGGRRPLFQRTKALASAICSVRHPLRTVALEGRVGLPVR